MPEVENEVIFEIPTASLYFATQQNGDKLVISNIGLNQDQATTIAWLVNVPLDAILEVQIRVKE